MNLNIDFNKLITYEIPDGVIGESGVKAVDDAILNLFFNDDILPPPFSLSGLINSDEAWKNWLITKHPDYVGTFPKRYSKFLVKHNIKPEPQKVAKLGEIFRAWCGKSGVLYVDFCSRPDWEAGSFGESRSSCWWNEYNGGREAFLEHNGMAMRTFNREQADKYKHPMYEGTGRCWMYETNYGLAIFNAYGPNSLLTLARAASGILGLPYSKARFSADSSTYLNGDGYLLAYGEPAPERGIYLDFADDACSQRCCSCGEGLQDDDIYHDADGDHYCCDCYNDRYWTCCRCGEEQSQSNDTQYDVSGHDPLCERCVGRLGYTICSSCGETFLDDGNNEECENCRPQEEEG